jgi:ATP-dependent RNA helicase DeaD
VPSEFRKAQRLLQGAKVVAEWASAPSAEEVQERDDQRILEHPALGPNDGEDVALAGVLLDRFGAEQVAMAFVKLWREGRSSPEVLADVNAPNAAPAPRDRGEFGASVWYSISVGRAGRAEARWLLPKICEAGAITKDGIGAIRVQENETFVQIAANLADKFKDGLPLEAGVDMRRMAGEPVMDRPERAPGKPARDKPAYKPKPSRFVEDDNAGQVLAEAATFNKPRAEFAAEPKPKRKPKAAAEAWSPDTGAAPAEAPKPAVKPEKKAYVKRQEGDGKPWEKRDAPARKPAANRAEGGAKPYVRRSEGGDTAYAPRKDGAKPYVKRSEGGETAYAPRKDGAKPYVKRSEGGETAYAPRKDGAKPYAPRGATPEAGGERKPRWNAESKPAGKPAARSSGFKSHGGPASGGGEGRPARAPGFKSHSAEGKSFVKPGGGKPFVKTAKPKANPSDTSKRFVPPSKPRG